MVATGEIVDGDLVRFYKPRPCYATWPSEVVTIQSLGPEHQKLHINLYTKLANPWQGFF